MAVGRGSLQRAANTEAASKTEKNVVTGDKAVSKEAAKGKTNKQNVKATSKAANATKTAVTKASVTKTSVIGATSPEVMKSIDKIGKMYQIGKELPTYLL